MVSNDEQLDTRMAAGDNPNVYIGVFGYQPAKLAKLGKLAYLDKFPGFAELNERIDPHFLRENFGRTYYIPWNATTQMMIYNKELFAEAGLILSALQRPGMNFYWRPKRSPPCPSLRR